MSSVSPGRRTASHQRDRAELALAAEEAARLDEAKARAEAEKKQTLAENVNLFFTDRVLGLADTARIEGSDTTTLIAAIDYAAEHVDESFPNDPLIAAQIHRKIGESYRGMGRFDQAIEQFERMIELQRQVQQPDDPEMLFALHMLGTAYRLANRLDEAEQVLRGVVAYPISVTRDEVERGYVELAWSRTSLGFILLLQERDPAEILPLFQADREKQKELLDEETQLSLQTVGGIVMCYWRQGRHEEALKLNQQNIDAYEKLAGPDHPERLTALGNQASFYRDLGRMDESIELLLEVDALSAKRLGPDHPNRLQKMASLAFTIGTNGDLARADAMFDEAMELARNSSADTAFMQFQILRYKGVAHREAGDPQGAEAPLLEANALAEQILPPGHPRRTGMLESLAKLYTLLGNSEKAADWQARFDKATAGE